MTKVLEALGGRKFFSFVVVIAVGVAVEVLSAKGLSTNLLTLLLTAAGIYTATNVYQKKVLGEVETPAVEAVPQPAFDVTPVTNHLDEIKAIASEVREISSENLKVSNALSQFALQAAQGVR